MIAIRGKALGRKKPLFADFSIPLPPDLGDGGALTLRSLIERIVRQEVIAFRQRQTDRQLLKALSAAQIEAGTAAGKITSGESEVAPQEVDEDQAIGTALQAFEDGIYLVAIDGNEQRKLEDQIFLRDDSTVTFIRLTLLAGG
ncbi:hypothetical protein [Anatilimnocola floriformis]|uniref:hypothetical protein n=1 Tax=Anatilimnocola floriformis TaxID=2948575 RepID=UPI0020C27F38|nr:hypothetical protein [Anatilimnocola floriformis]